MYLAGDNTLTEAMVLALQTLKTLKAAGRFARGAIVAQLDPSGVGLPTQTYDFTGVLRSGRLRMIPQLDEFLDPSYSLSETNTGNPNALSGFVEWAHQKYPRAKHHLLILSGHGSGTTEDFLLKDDNSMDALSIDELGIALTAAHRILKKRIDILGMDACFMSMGEVCYQIRDHVDIVVGAEGMEPEFGWPYSRILDEADKVADGGHSLEPRELATIIVRQYVDFYSDFDRSAGRSVDLASVDLRKIGPLRGQLRKLIQAVRRSKVGDRFDRIVLAHWYAQTYKADQFVDLKDLCERIKEAFKGVRGAVKIERACNGVISALKECVIKSGCSGFAYQNSYGLSVYFPWSVVCPDYRALNFAKSSGWGAFLEDLVRTTRRKPRFDDGLRRHDTRVVDALTAVFTQANIEPLQSAMMPDIGLDPRTSRRSLATSTRSIRPLSAMSGVLAEERTRNCPSN